MIYYLSTKLQDEGWVFYDKYDTLDEAFKEKRGLQK